ncbi:MAG: ABC transporter permease [Deltaproteobacteria bacterium]|nr:ABC transporter permease [Deltaproteobacteria bacterium]
MPGSTRRGHAVALIGAVLVAILVFCTTLAPVLDKHDPLAKNLASGVTELGTPLPPGLDHPLGTDMLGRCVAARVMHGAAHSLAIGVAATLVALTIGVLVGAWAGMAGGLADTLLMRLCDLVLAFPFLLLVIAVAAVLRDSAAARTTVFLILGIAGWTTMARVVRAKVLLLRELDFVAAARAAGAGRVRILFRHVLSNLWGPILVLSTMAVGQMILAESTLSYLGLGTPPPSPTWGRMLREGQPYLRGAPWMVIAPGVAIVLAVLGFQLLGEGVRKMIDPRRPGRE